MPDFERMGELAPSPDGSRVFVAVLVDDISTAMIVHGDGGKLGPVVMTGVPVNEVYSADGKRLAVRGAAGGADRVYYLDATTGQQLGSFRRRARPLAFTAGGDLLVIDNESNKLA